MSVTFAAESVTTGRCYIACHTDEGEVRFGPYESFAEAQEAAVALQADTSLHGRFIEAESLTSGLPEVNMANSNARDLLLALDLPTDDLCGHEDAATFRARVLLALATDRLDAEEPAYTVKQEGGATFHFGGRRAGYVEERLIGLLAVAEAAEGYGVGVVWY